MGAVIAVAVGACGVAFTLLGTAGLFAQWRRGTP